MKDTIQFLKELQKEMLEQPTDIQASPRFWVLCDKKTVACLEENATDYEIYDPASAESTSIDEHIEDAAEALDEYSNGEQEDPVAEYYEHNSPAYSIHALVESHSIDIEGAKYALEHSNGPEAQFEWLMAYGPVLIDMSDDIELIPVEQVSYIVPNTMFITKQDAIDYIKRYGYNHTKDLHTFAMTAVRSPKVEKLYNIIHNTEWEELEKILEHTDDQKGGGTA